MDALRDTQGNVVICGIMEHIEQASDASLAGKGGRCVTQMARARAHTHTHTHPHTHTHTFMAHAHARVHNRANICTRAHTPSHPQAGIHSGDSACSLPTQSIPEETLDLIRKWTKEVAESLGVVGLINIQYAIQVREGRGRLRAFCSRRVAVVSRRDAG